MGNRKKGETDEDIMVKEILTYLFNVAKERAGRRKRYVFSACKKKPSEPLRMPAES